MSCPDANYSIFQTILKLRPNPLQEKNPPIVVPGDEVAEVNLQPDLAIGSASIAIIAILPSERPATNAKNPGLNPQVAMVGKVPPEVAVVSEDMNFVGEATGVVIPTDVEGLGVFIKSPRLFITVNGTGFQI